jgi:hypothetical protein
VHIAQVNIARMLAPLDDPQLAGFVARLEDINALADTAPGFVWRLQTAEGDATAFRPYGDDRILFNLSVWRTVEELKAFVYRTAHNDVMRRRAEWFARATDPYYALWWVDEGTIPGIDEAKDRLERLRRDGPSSAAFTFRRIYDHPVLP